MTTALDLMKGYNIRQLLTENITVTDLYQHVLVLKSNQVHIIPSKKNMSICRYMIKKTCMDKLTSKCCYHSNSRSCAVFGGQLEKTTTTYSLTMVEQHRTTNSDQ